MSNYIYYDYASSQVCKVKEDSNEYIKASNIPSYLDTLCLENGSSLKGRMDAFKHIMQKKKFIPIIVHASLIYFPIKSTSAYDCIWINYFSIEHVVYAKKICTIYFYDHTYLECSHPKRIQQTLYAIRRYLYILATRTTTTG